jgi:hypothetical protein
MNAARSPCRDAHFVRAVAEPLVSKRGDATSRSPTA